jgi:glycosyltransferase involved in cell wall biosynthesis
MKTRVLIVCGGNGNKIAPFIQLQKENLENLGIEVEYFLINRSGLFGYLSLLPKYWKTVRHFNPKVIHAHYGISGFFALMQLRKQVIISYIGSDILLNGIKFISYLSMFFSKYSIFISNYLFESVPFKRANFKTIPYGINLDKFHPVEKVFARESLGWDVNKIYCLFPSAKERPEKNFELASKAIRKVGKIELIEIGGTLSLDELNLIFNACDFMLLTSFHEGGPQVLFEALAVNLPVICTDVGAVRQTIEGVDGCLICSYELNDVVQKINIILELSKRTNGRKRIQELQLDSKIQALRLLDLYSN